MSNTESLLALCVESLVGISHQLLSLQMLVGSTDESISKQAKESMLKQAKATLETDETIMKGLKEILEKEAHE